MREIQINIAPIVGLMVGINYYNSYMEYMEDEPNIHTLQIMLAFVCIEIVW